MKTISRVLWYTILKPIILPNQSPWEFLVKSQHLLFGKTWLRGQYGPLEMYSLRTRSLILASYFSIYFQSPRSLTIVHIKLQMSSIYGQIRTRNRRKLRSRAATIRFIWILGLLIRILNIIYKKNQKTKVLKLQFIAKSSRLVIIRKCCYLLNSDYIRNVN